MTQEAIETPAEHKLRAIRVTAAARFSAVQRLRRHESVSLFSITMCSLGVVVISLLEPFGVRLSVPSGAVNLSAAIVSMLILVVSLLVSGRKYGERAEKMHAGAIEINAVSRKLEMAISRDEQQEIDALSEQYESLLKMYENHEDVDYKVAQIKRYAKHYKVGTLDRMICWCRLQLDIALHLIPLLILVVLLYVLLKDASLQATVPLSSAGKTYPSIERTSPGEPGDVSHVKR
ncbi:SLATT domain-containing protein [Methylibium petroleiphilum]|nr:SLATT domain-containing protein [Methylibium petroleiphilum]